MSNPVYSTSLMKLITKLNHMISSLLRNPSCSRGWLRWVVQSTFGIITVASFVLILIMAVSRLPAKDSACTVSNCRVTCEQAFFDHYYERDIMVAISETGMSCDRIILSLRDVQFPNGTMPLSWLNRIPSNVQRLFLSGGNLRHIPPTAFLGQFSGGLKELVLEDITITTWTSDTFVGLSNLQLLEIKDSVLVNLERNALRAVHDTIQIISVTNCGKWNPRFVTGLKGLERLENVHLSQNQFGDSIKAHTFSGLRKCKVLFLNSCKITSIGAGAFDPLENIEMLFLNDNYLVKVPPDLFATILRIEEPKPRIHLQDNLWTCNCSQNDLILLSKNDLLLVDPLCYQPDHLNGRPLSKLEQYCSNDTDIDIEVIILPKDDMKLSTPVGRLCFHGNYLTSNNSLKIVSPTVQFQCQLEQVRHFERIPQQLPENEHANEIADTWLNLTFAMQNSAFMMMQIRSSAPNGYGIVWHQSTCPNEAYCLNVMPNFLRVYDVILDTQYTFCPINLLTYEIQINNCIRYIASFVNDPQKETLKLSLVFYIATGLFSALLGATLVYGLIRKNPTLLKGSKRLLFVKHRGVDALVLPPKIPLRNYSMRDDNTDFKENRIFTVHNDEHNFHRSNSVRSANSITPTYVSAMQPIESHLAEWRIRHHFDKNDSIISISSDKSRYLWICDDDSTSTIPYDSFK